MNRQKRNPQPTQKFKPENFKTKPKAQKPKKQPKQPKQNQQKQTQPKPAQAKSINKAPRDVEFYKELKLMNDASSQAYENSLKLLDFNQYTDPTKSFTLWDKFEAMVESINLYVNGPNAWTNGIYKLDYTPEQYKKIKYNVVPTLEDLKQNKYANIGPVKSDKGPASMINFIKKNVPDVPQDLQDLKWIIENHRKILNQMLIIRFNKGQSVATIRNDIYDFARLLKIAFGPDNELHKKLVMLATDFDYAVVKDQEGKNQLNKYEELKFLPYGALLDLVEEMNKQFRESLKNKGKDHQETYKLHMYALILQAYLYTPPVRLELSDCKFTSTLNNLNNNTDYIYLPNDKSKLCEYVFNKDKKKHGAIRYFVGYMINTKAKISENLSPYAFKLSDFIRESYALYPREYFITQIKDRNKPAKANMPTYLKYMFDKHQLNVNMFRSSFITWLYQNNTPNKILQDVALKMRNSVMQQQATYKKSLSKNEMIQIKQEKGFTDPQPAAAETIRIKQEPTDEIQPIESVQHTIRQPNKPPIKDPRISERARQKKYYDKKKIDILEKKKQQYEDNKDKITARKIIKRLNDIISTGGNAKPTAASMATYQLYKEGNIWKSRII